MARSAHKQFIRTDDATKRIVSVQFKRDVDDSPDLSFLGEYTADPGDDDKTIDRKENGDMGRHEYRYFVAAMSGADTGNPASVEEDYRRMERYNAGDWCMCFCQASARVSVNGVMQTVTSGGIGGVESDSDASYFDELREEEFAEIRGILESMGFTSEQIDEAFADAESD